MPNSKTTPHLDMYIKGRSRHRLLKRLGAALRTLRHGKLEIYGIEWGDPDVLPSFKYISDHYLLPHVSPHSSIL